MIIILHINYNHDQVSYISKINTLCYSWIDYNKYEVKDKLCKINCSYIRFKSFPLSYPLKCNNYYSFEKNANVTFKIYLFNTTTYGKYVNKYRFYYNNTHVYYFLCFRIIGKC